MSDLPDSHDLDELLGAYALDAVSPEEADRVEDYLAINPRAAAEVREHREVATMLAFTGMDAPEGLWSRIEQELDAPAPAPGPELARVMSIENAPSRRRFATVAPWIASAAAAAIVAVVAIGIADRTTAPTDPLVAAYEAADADRDSAKATLVAEGSSFEAVAVIDQDGHGYVRAGELPALGADQTYQLWGVVDTGADEPDVISLGIFGPNPELETFTTETPVVALAITIEDAPGVISDGNPEGIYVGTIG
ncbi:MAG: anti-sigma factor [Ilumatobacter sp.]|uniref:anti-sigma factor n=1 Tax=Ilumatobacter sp. TaxID=1967498 RepID=UPI002A2716DC|nr:anti-sigma factor [Ilumatobacter sp.]MDG1392145.1 anti-sigma factor [Ilumatobacter sp.]